jgi:adenine/guanine phosphoribosyltransferase-like PRPP-binding protein
VAVPSVRGRVGVHPFDVIARQMNAARESPRLAVSQGDTGARVVSVDRFTLDPETDLAGQHVLILDDTWTTGANAQSAVLAARRAGATAVSVMVVGRWLRPDFGHNAQFIKTRLARDYDPWICPVTGEECP